MQGNIKWILFGGVISIAIVTIGVALPVAFQNNSNAMAETIWKGSMVLNEVPLIDGHNDLPHNIYTLERNQLQNFNFDSDLKEHPIWGKTSSSHTDLPRLKQGKVGGQFWVAYVECVGAQHKDAVERTMDQIDVIKRLVEKYPNDMKFVTTAEGILKSFEEKKIASLIGVEGGHSIDSRLSILRLYYELGVRYMTLTHSCNQPWIDASPIDIDPSTTKTNLTTWGKEVIFEMNRLGMLVDLSHVSHGVMSAVLDITKAPVIFSHSSSYSVKAHHRNVHDDILLRLVANNGIVMVNFYNVFLGGDNIDIVIQHLNHIKSITGVDHIGIGGDFDGVTETPSGLEDVSKYPNLFDKLAENNHGYEPWTREDLQKLAGLNLIRVFKKVEEISASLKSELPHESLIPEEDLYQSANQTCRTDFHFTPTSE